MQSIFSSLWKTRDIREDFRTEILCWVLRSLNSLSALEDFFKHFGLEVKKFNNPIISTQMMLATNRFDIYIKDSNHIIIFEIKWDSPTNLVQLATYDDYLHKNEQSFSALLHVTKDYQPVITKFKSKFIKLTWSQIYDYLSKYDDNEIISEFLYFLENEGIAMRKVTWEIENGSKSIYSLTRIVQRASEELDLRHSWKPGSADYTAQCIDDTIYAYYLFKDSKLYFCVYGKTKPSEELKETVWSDDHGLYFDFDKECFFHKNIEEQVDILKGFIVNFKSLIKISQAQQS